MFVLIGDAGFSFEKIAHPEDFNKAIVLKPGFIEAYSNRGLDYYKLSQYQQDIEDYNYVIRLKPDY